MTRAFAERSGRELHYYYSVDTHKNLPITDDDLRDHLYSLSTGTTNQRLGALPLVIGMPVMITQNFDIQGGVVNSSTGILKKIRYHEDDAGRRIATSCVVDIPTMTGDCLPELTPHEAVVLKDTVDM
ncbi:uncharacterized protein EV420DRAFT_1267526, partial [Desarmillaria tabescens]